MSNHVVPLEGNIGTEIKLKNTSSGKVAEFRVVTNDRKQINGNWTDTNTIGWNIEVWGDKQAQAVSDRLEIGDPVVMLGKFKDDSWTNSEGKRVDRLVFSASIVGLDIARAKIRS